MIIPSAEEYRDRTRAFYFKKYNTSSRGEMWAGIIVMQEELHLALFYQSPPSSRNLR